MKIKSAAVGVKQGVSEFHAMKVLKVTPKTGFIQ